MKRIYLSEWEHLITQNMVPQFAWNLVTYFHLSNQARAWSKSQYMLYNQKNCALFSRKLLVIVIAHNKVSLEKKRRF